MFKKENRLTTFFVVIMLVFISLTIYGVFFKEEEKPIENNEPTEENTINKTYFIPTKNDPTLGDKTAPVEVINFSDVKCPYCAQWEKEILPKLKEEYIDSGQAKLVFKNLPFLSDYSTIGALAGESVYHQDEELFWDFISLMFEHNDDETSHDFIMEMVKENLLDLDHELLSKDIIEETYLQDVLDDKQIGLQSKVTGTPAIFINGVQVKEPFDYSAIQELIESQSN